MKYRGAEVRLLYRGVSEEMFSKTGGLLIPKKLGRFEYQFCYDEPGLTYDSGAMYGSTTENAVVRHQLNQEGFETAGISTTPNRSRAEYYATASYQKQSGYIFVIDRSKLDAHEVREYIVNKHVTSPAVPEDEEVILVAKDGGVLPSEIILEVVPFGVQQLVR